jgi:hypothetical protein
MKVFFLITMFVFLDGCEDIPNKRKPLPLTDVTKPQVSTLGPNTVLNSQLPRERGAQILSYADEIKKILANDLSEKLYRQVPLIEKDDEGSSLNVLTMNDLGRPQIDCGGDGVFSGINARLLDCFNKNNNSSLWIGQIHGASGESVWKLVTKVGSKEVWLDDRTGLVWSYVLPSVNWCKASGNTEMDSTFVKFNCSTLSELQSVCAGNTLDLLGTQVKWRLPTRNDFLQADLNGLRFVLKKESATQGLWTSTIRAASSKRGEAWVYHSLEGTLSADTLDADHGVRCVGAPVR